MSISDGVGVVALTEPITHVRYIKITILLRGFLVILLYLVLVFFVLKSLLGIGRQWSLEKFSILTL